MVYGLWFMVYGLGFMVHCVWFMVYGLGFMVHCVWFMIYNLGFMVHGLWFMVKGLVPRNLALEQRHSGPRALEFRVLMLPVQQMLFRTDVYVPRSRRCRSTHKR
jgi:hypothetical protein